MSQERATSHDASTTRLPEPMEDKALSWPWRRLLHYEALESTQRHGAQMLAMGRDVKGLVYWAERQTRGQGRFGHTWVSNAGGLYVTAALPYALALPPAETGWLALAAALACAEILQEQLAVEASIKWPNDVLVEGRKVAGFLGEIKHPARPAEGADPAEKTPASAVLIGMGLNWLNGIRVAAETGGFSAASLDEFRPGLELAGRGPFLLAWLARLARWHNTLVGEPRAGLATLQEAIEARLWRKGETVTLQNTEKGAVAGTFLGLGQDAAARLRTADGAELQLHCGWQTASA